MFPFYKKALYAALACVMFVCGWQVTRCVIAEVCVLSILEPIVRDSATLTTKHGVIKAEVVQTNEAREQGLSGRVGLAPHTGMLFVFPSLARYGFWMKDMTFPLDIIWINDKGTIVNVIERALPEDYPTTYVNQVSAKYVLEINAGTAHDEGLYLGSKVTIEMK
jgi:uncharacterized membrane protein (UPF0127 family)